MYCTLKELLVTTSVCLCLGAIHCLKNMTNIWLLSAMGMDTISIHSQVKLLHSRQVFISFWLTLHLFWHDVMTIIELPGIGT